MGQLLLIVLENDMVMHIITKSVSSISGWREGSKEPLKLKHIQKVRSTPRNSSIFFFPSLKRVFLQCKSHLQYHFTLVLQPSFVSAQQKVGCCFKIGPWNKGLKQQSLVGARVLTIVVRHQSSPWTAVSAQEEQWIVAMSRAAGVIRAGIFQVSFTAKENWSCKYSISSKLKNVS